jgi:transposase
MRGVRIQIEKPKVIKELWRKEEAPSVYKKLLFLNAVANYDTSFEQATEMFQVPQPTAYEWIRKWNRDGYEGLLFKKDVAKGRPPKLGGEEIGRLEELLKEREFWQTSEVVGLIAQEFGVRFSEDQVRRILRGKLRMNFSKPFPKDYRRPDNAEEARGRQLELGYKYLTEVKGYGFEEIALGFVDESARQSENSMPSDH